MYAKNSPIAVTGVMNTLRLQKVTCFDKYIAISSRDIFIVRRT